MLQDRPQPHQEPGNQSRDAINVGKQRGKKYKKYLKYAFVALFGFFLSLFARQLPLKAELFFYCAELCFLFIVLLSD